MRKNLLPLTMRVALMAALSLVFSSAATGPAAAHGTSRSSGQAAEQTPVAGGEDLAGAGLITGTVINVTTGLPAADAPVTLDILDEATRVEQRETTADGSGRYEFAGLPTDAVYGYRASAQYPAGAVYVSDLINFAEGQSAVELPIAVYEATSDPAGITAERVHFIVDFQQGVAVVTELVVFGLSGDRAYVGDGSGTVRVDLPAGAMGLEISGDETGERYTVTSGGFADRLPLPPGSGSRQLFYRYLLPLTGPDLELARSLPYPVTAINAMVSDMGGKVSSPQLTSQGSRSTQNGSYVVLGGANLPAGHPISISIAGAATPASSESGSASTASYAGMLGVVIALAVAAAGLIVWLVLSRRGRTAQRPTAARATAAGEATSVSLQDALAELEESYRSGEISEAAYRERRIRLKAALLDEVDRS